MNVFCLSFFFGDYSYSYFCILASWQVLLICYLRLWVYCFCFVFRFEVSLFTVRWYVSCSTFTLLFFVFCDCTSFSIFILLLFAVCKIKYTSSWYIHFCQWLFLVSIILLLFNLFLVKMWCNQCIGHDQLFKSTFVNQNLVVPGT